MRGEAWSPGLQRETRIWSGPDFWLTGITYPSFWRTQDVPVRIGNRVERGLHLVQVWMRYKGRPSEVLVVYPRDGYWRARPLPFGTLHETAYGSSFLIGPVEVQERPLVALTEIAFDPQTKSFHLAFELGGSARIAMTGIDQHEIRLDCTYSGAMPDGRAFASLRSMYATDPSLTSRGLPGARLAPPTGARRRCWIFPAHLPSPNSGRGGARNRVTI